MSISNSETNKLNLEKYYEYDISKEEIGKGIILNPQYHIQSLCIGKSFIENIFSLLILLNSKDQCLF